jgi:N-acetyl-gamma-glutamyl-phosphate reductase
MTRIFIDGAQGTTGLEIRERLAGRADLSFLEIEEARRKDAGARREALNEADIVILCLPDDAAREAVGMIDTATTRVIDASTAHRTAPGWTYGFPELGFDVASAMRVSNPGCYPTGFLALVAPLVRAGLVPADWPLTVNAVSGYSGGGKAMIEEFESGRADTAWRSYALSLAHKHVPEMQTHAGLAHAPLFAPSVANAYRGMVVEVPLITGAIPGRPSPAALREALAGAFEHSTTVALAKEPDPALLTLEQAALTDRLDLFVFANAQGTQVRLAAALDNLGKGAAGAAVQSLNLMAGVAETTGLRLHI